MTGRDGVLLALEVWVVDARAVRGSAPSQRSVTWLGLELDVEILRRHVSAIWPCDAVGLDRNLREHCLIRPSVIEHGTPEVRLKIELAGKSVVEHEPDDAIANHRDVDDPRQVVHPWHRILLSLRRLDPTRGLTVARCPPSRSEFPLMCACPPEHAASDARRARPALVEELESHDVQGGPEVLIAHVDVWWRMVAREYPHDNSAEATQLGHTRQPGRVGATTRARVTHLRTSRDVRALWTSWSEHAAA